MIALRKLFQGKKGVGKNVSLGESDYPNVYLLSFCIMVEQAREKRSYCSRDSAPFALLCSTCFPIHMTDSSWKYLQASQVKILLGNGMAISKPSIRGVFSQTRWQLQVHLLKAVELPVYQNQKGCLSIVPKLQRRPLKVCPEQFSVFLVTIEGYSN